MLTLVAGVTSARAADLQAIHVIAANGLFQIDPAGGAGDAPIAVFHADDLAISSDGSRAFLVGGKALSVVDLGRGVTTARVALPENQYGGGYDAIEPTPDGRAAYLFDRHAYGASTVLVLDPAGETIVGRLALPGHDGRRAVAFNAAANRAYFTATESVGFPTAATVTVVDTTRHAVVDAIRIDAIADFIQLASDGDTAYVGGNAELAVLDLATRRIVWRIALDARVTGLQIAADGRTLYAALGPGEGAAPPAVAVVDLATLRIARRLPLPAPAELVGLLGDKLVLHMDRPLLASRAVAILYPATGTLGVSAERADVVALGAAPPVLEPIAHLPFPPRDIARECVLGADMDGSRLTLFDPTSGSGATAPFLTGIEWVDAVAASPDGAVLHALVSTGAAQELVSVELASRRRLSALPVAPCEQARLHADPHGRYVALTCDESAYRLQLVDLTVPRVALLALPGDAACLEHWAPRADDVAFAADGHVYASARCEDRTSETWWRTLVAIDAVTNTVAWALPIGAGGPTPLVVSGDARTAWVGGAVVDLTARRIRARLPMPNGLTDLALSRDGAQLYATGRAHARSTGTLRVFHTADDRVAHTLPLSDLRELPGRVGVDATGTHARAVPVRDHLAAAAPDDWHPLSLWASPPPPRAAVIEGPCPLLDGAAPLAEPTERPTPTPSPSPAPSVFLAVQPSDDQPARIAVRLLDGDGVVAVQNDLAWDAALPVAARADGRPDCEVDPAIEKELTAFAFLAGGGLRALVLSFDSPAPIAPGSLLYTCRLGVSPDTPAGTYRFACAKPGASDAAGRALATDCADGSIAVGARTAVAPQLASQRGGGGCAVAPAALPAGATWLIPIGLLLAGVRRRAWRAQRASGK